MIDVGTAVLTAFHSKLNNLSVGSDTIKSYSEYNPNESETKYFLLSAMTEDDNSNKAKNVTNVSILVDCVHKSGQAVTYDTVNLMAQAAITSLETLAVPVAYTATLKFLLVRRESANQLYTPSSTGNVMRKLLRYTLTVQEL